MAVVKSRQQLRITGSTVCLAVSRLCVQEGPSEWMRLHHASIVPRCFPLPADSCPYRQVKDTETPMP